MKFSSSIMKLLRSILAGLSYELFKYKDTRKKTRGVTRCCLATTDYNNNLDRSFHTKLVSGACIRCSNKYKHQWLCTRSKRHCYLIEVAQYTPYKYTYRRYLVFKYLLGYLQEVPRSITYILTRHLQLGNL